MEHKILFVISCIGLVAILNVATGQKYILFNRLREAIRTIKLSFGRKENSDGNGAY